MRGIDVFLEGGGEIQKAKKKKRGSLRLRRNLTCGILGLDLQVRRLKS